MKQFVIGLSWATLACVIAVPQFARAEGPLDANLFQSNCPLNDPEDPFNFDGIADAVKDALKEKLAHREECRAPLVALNTNLTAIQNAFGGLSDEE